MGGNYIKSMLAHKKTRLVIRRLRYQMIFLHLKYSYDVGWKTKRKKLLILVWHKIQQAL